MSMEEALWIGNANFMIYQHHWNRIFIDTSLRILIRDEEGIAFNLFIIR